LLLKIIKSNFRWKKVVLLATVMKGSDGSKNVIEVVGEALRMTNGVRNSCGDDCPVLGTPFIQWRWCTTAHLGIELGCGGPTSMRYDCGCQVHRSANGGQGNRQGLKGWKGRRAAPGGTDVGKRCSLYASTVAYATCVSRLTQ
jgi:hypothetical protein